MTIRDNLGTLRRTVRRQGVATTTRRLGRRVARWIDARVDAESLSAPLLAEDVRWAPRPAAAPPRRDPGESLHIGWVCVPPAAGSGGHTTLFRMVEMAERLGHRCTLFLYDTASTDVDHHAGVIRRAWPGLRAEVRSARPAISGIDAVVAGSWETAHVVLSRTDPGIPASYFIQDYEPFFHPRGPLWALAEQSYHLGLSTIALGEMVAGCLRTFAGVEPDLVVPFGCDTTTYRLLADPDGAGEGADRKDVDGARGDGERRTGRSGVVLYAKPGAARRGYPLAREALRIFHREHPEVPIHAVGDTPAGSLGVRAVVHGSLTPTVLNALYNEVRVGLALSFTNISLVAEEMMAAGVVPVVNSSPMARADLPQVGPLWAPPTPRALADALWSVVKDPATEAEVRRLSAAARQGWDGTARTVVGRITGVPAGVAR